MYKLFFKKIILDVGVSIQLLFIQTLPDTNVI